MFPGKKDEKVEMDIIKYVTFFLMMVGHTENKKNISASWNKTELVRSIFPGNSSLVYQYVS